MLQNKEEYLQLHWENLQKNWEYLHWENLEKRESTYGWEAEDNMEVSPNSTAVIIVKVFILFNSSRKLFLHDRHQLLENLVHFVTGK